MEAIRLLRPCELTLDSLPDPEPGEGEVLVSLEGTGVCASNLPLWQGSPWLDYPLAPGTGGHEAWGVVQRVGPGVSPKLEGQRVAVLSYRAYATKDVARAEHLVPLPASLAGVPFPGEAIGCAVNIFSRSDIRAGQRVVIVGIGFLGALLTQLAVRVGAEVIATSRRTHALAIARRMGAHHAIALEDQGAIIEQVRELTHGALCPRVIEATGKQWPLDLSGELTQEGGRLIIAGYHQDGPRTVNMQLWNYRGLDVINAHERDPRVSTRGMRQAVQLVTEGALDPTPLYTHSYSLAELGAAFDAVAERPDGFMKALIQLERSPC